MDARASSLWRRVRTALTAKGWGLCRRPDPEQLGLLVLQISRDDRLLRLVRDYYYPRAYGGLSPVLADEAAEDLVRGFESRAPRPQAARVLTLEDVRCSLCGEEVKGDDQHKG